MAKESQYLVVSNRLPVVVDGTQGEWRIKPAAGGLVTALGPIMARRQGLWVGWPGSWEDAPFAQLFEQFTRDHGYRLAAVPLSEEDVELYYRGFSNETLWPLFHDLLGHCNFDLDTWHRYVEVNQRFADAIMSNVTEEDLIWVHDYQLILLGKNLREKGVNKKLAFFLHIPFPGYDLFRRLPWRKEILEALLAYDLLGFQTLGDRRNFVACVREFFPDIHAETSRRITRLELRDRQVSVGHFPISINFEEFHQGALEKAVQDAAWYLHEHYQGRQLLLGIDRLDYTKGIPERFLAFERALEKYPELRQQVSLIQVVVPSRTLVPGYQDLKETLEQLTGRINARFGEHGWVPIHYLFRSLDRTQLLAHYRTCEIALISPLRDGMNLVAKEYCAASVEGNGVLILSEFAGAAAQLACGALLVNPYDVERTAEAIWQAYSMPNEERRERMNRLRDQVRSHDVERWVKQFLDAVPASRQ